MECGQEHDRKQQISSVVLYCVLFQRLIYQCTLSSRLLTNCITRCSMMILMQLTPVKSSPVACLKMWRPMRICIKICNSSYEVLVGPMSFKGLSEPTARRLLTCVLTINMAYLILLLSTALCWLTYQSIYRLFFHPLSHIPGPRLAAVSYIYQFYFDVIKGGKYIWEVRRLHEEYGNKILIIHGLI